jgi:phosphoenolpyruvate carboxylase
MAAVRRAARRGDAGPADAPSPPSAAAELEAELASRLARLEAEHAEDPFANPIQRLALDISRRMEAGGLGLAEVEGLVQRLAVEGFLGRAERLGGLMGEADPAANAAAVRRIVSAMAEAPDGGSVPFEAFRHRVGREAFGVVITAHPTFNLSGALMRALVLLATGREEDGTPLSGARRAEIVAEAAAVPHRPDPDLTLAREHELSVTVLAHLQDALGVLYREVFAVAAERYPDRWTELTPRLVTVASWVGYDVDGRSDIKWTDTLRKRLIVQAAQLRRFQAEARAVRAALPPGEDLRHTVELLESRLALALAELGDEIEAFAADPDTAEGAAAVRRASRRMWEGRELRMVDASLPTELLDRAIRLALAGGHGDAARPALVRLCAMRAAVANTGLGLAHTHVRINATQLHNAIRKTVGLETAPDDPRFRQSYLAAIGDLLDRVRPCTINFGSLMAERTSSKRLMMTVAQMLKYADASTPVRFLIAECEAAFTPLVALYYARLFGVEDRIDICPLFETERALEVGSRVVDQLLENRHFNAYVRARGRLCIQTGYSDAGRYLGQTPAAASIERLKLRIARLFPRHGLDGVQLVVFDTHGESIGRGAHPAGFPDRLSYVCTPYVLALADELGVGLKQEVSFQGGDGFLHFLTPPAALAAVTRILEFLHDAPAAAAAAASDPFYEDPDYITEFFTTVKAFQDGLVRDPDYAALVGAVGPGLLYPSGSRATRRQHEGAAVSEPHSVTQLRAIPHNAILLQLGLPANVLGGLGAAIGKDPDRFLQLYAASPRFRQLIGIAEYGLAVACPDALRAAIASADPETWIRRAAAADDRALAADFQALARHLDEDELHTRQMRVFRRLAADLVPLRDGLARTGTPGAAAMVTGEARAGIRLLQAIRLALMNRVQRLAVRIPRFSSQHAVSQEQMTARILRMDVPSADAQLRRIFPAEAPSRADEDFGEPARYASDDDQGYRTENRTIFDPMVEAYDLVRRCGVAIAHRIGFFG